MRVLSTRTLVLTLAALAIVAGCAKPAGAPSATYRLPYANGTEVTRVATKADGAIGFAAVGAGPHTVVAARAGIIRAMDDSHGATCCETSCPNNYIWVQHQGDEWTKYTHLAQGSISALGHSKGLTVRAGQPIGTEGNVGLSCTGESGQHLSFEIREVISSGSPLPEAETGLLPGPLRTANFCVPGGVAPGGTYTAGACP